MTTAEFIREYRERDIRQLALQANRFPDVDMPYALDQIQGWQIARRKLPKWAACDGVIFPPHLSMEQCSSEPTAQYKLNLAMEWTTLNSELSTLLAHSIARLSLYCAVGSDEHCSIERCGG